MPHRVIATLNLYDGRSEKDTKRKLERVTDAEWESAMKTLSDYITWKLRGRTRCGAHSEAELGQRAVSFYMLEAYMKLADYLWEWKDNHTLEEQLMRIASSLIRKREEKYIRSQSCNR